jgi:hypothetical protein
MSRVVKLKGGNFHVIFILSEEMSYHISIQLKNKNANRGIKFVILYWKLI